MFKSEIRLPSGKQPHSYGKIHHFSWENPLFLWPCSMLNYQRVRKTMHKPIWSKVSGLVRLCALIIHVYPCLCRDSDGLKSSTSHQVTHGATHCAQGHMLHPWGRKPLFNKNQMSQVTLLVDIGSRKIPRSAPSSSDVDIGSGVSFCIHCQFRAKSLSHRTAQEKRELREVGLGNPSRSSKVGVCGTLPWKNLPMSYQSTQCKCFGKILT